MNTKRLKVKADTDPSAPQRAYDFGINKTYQQYEGQMPYGLANLPPTNSSLPGDGGEDFKKVHPAELRKMYEKETNPERKQQLYKALKEWARQYSDSLINPYKYEKYFNDIEGDDKILDVATKVALKFAQVSDPQRNLFYYQDAETNAHPNISDGYLEPTVGDSNEVHNVHQLTYPRNFEQNRPENPSWAEGDFQTPYEGKLPEDLDVLRGAHKMGFFDNFVWCEEESLDQLFTSKKASVKKTAKIEKMADFNNFIKVGENLLVHKSEQDLWALETDEEGNFVISRLFDGNQIG